MVLAPPEKVHLYVKFMFVKITFILLLVCFYLWEINSFLCTFLFNS